jgi:L-threonylcarbamoyladenylate synthase
VTARIVRDDDAGRRLAIDVLQGGGIVALPTDTVYGIAVALGTVGGIERLFHVKHRPLDKGIALLIADAAQVSDLGELTPAAAALVEELWPGPLTLVLRARPGASLPDALSGGARTVGVRLPDHPAPRAMAAAVGPLPTTSANRSGKAEPLDAATVLAELGAEVDLILDGGRTRGARPSTVVDVTTDPPTVLRVGAVDEDRIRAILTAAAAVGR